MSRRAVNFRDTNRLFMAEKRRRKLLGSAFSLASNETVWFLYMDVAPCVIGCFRYSQPAYRVRLGQISLKMEVYNGLEDYD